MFLSKLELNLRSHEARRDLAEIYDMHRTIMRAFPDGTEGPGRVLFRVESGREASVTILVQSDKEPDWGRLAVPGDYFVRPPLTKPFKPSLYEGQQLIFRLMANPTVKRDGKRCGLICEEDQKRWIERKAGNGGFSILSLRIIPHRPVEGEKAGQGLKFTSVTYEGVLGITNPTEFNKTLEDGIGSAKGFGFGLLSIAPCH